MAERLDLQTIRDARGSLTVLERLPFDIKRVYYLHGIDVGAKRGGHAHRELDRIMVAVNGSFNVSVREKAWSYFEMRDPAVGLRIHPMEWIEVSDFTPGTVCLVLASREHDEADCIRDFEQLLRLRREAA